MNNINEKVRVERYSSILTKTRIDITEQKAIELQKHYLKNMLKVVNLFMVFAYYDINII